MGTRPVRAAVRGLGGYVVAEAVRRGEMDTSASASESEWARVLGHLKAEVGEAAYRSWLRPMSVERVDDGEAIVAVPTRFLRDWVATHYADRLLALWRAENQRVTSVSIVVAVAHRRNGLDHSAAHGGGSKKRDGPAPSFAEPAVVLEIGEDKAQLSALDQRFTFENFVVGKPNELAHAAARRVAEACANSFHTVPFNPLFLYGGGGCVV